MPVSATRACIATASKELVRLLASSGFKRQAPHLWRENGELIHVINFQASQWGTSTDGKFTVNLAITNRTIYSTWTGRPFPSNPGTAIWPIHTRIGRLLSDHDAWWTVSGSTDTKALASSVAAQIGPLALEWFSIYSGVDDLDASLAKVSRYGDVAGVYEAQAPLIRAIIASMQGKAAVAQKLLRQSLASNRGKPFEDAIALIASRLGIHVA